VTTLPQMSLSNIVKQPYGGFALDQDTGGAIRAAGRCDIYMGEGDQAGRLAGQTYQEGRLYYLFLKQ
jgi:membrane-bound lytic murein transglycosylase A